jgi:hypothetical protein
MTEVIDAANLLPALDQSVCKIGTDESGNAGDEKFRHR